MRLEFEGLKPLDTIANHEGWIIVAGAPISTGVFDVSADGTSSRSRFSLRRADLRRASSFVLTIEPDPDPDPAPSTTHILAGDFVGDDAGLSVAHPAAFGDGFALATGTYVLATPTDESADNERSGIWFLDPEAGPGPGLLLPPIRDGWFYEGWVMIDGIPVSTGFFREVDANDLYRPHSGGVMDDPPFPGEDFLVSPPEGLSLPTDLAGRTVVVSIEPLIRPRFQLGGVVVGQGLPVPPEAIPNTAQPIVVTLPTPFTLRPLIATVPIDATPGTAYAMTNNVETFPTGIASR